MAPAAIYNVLGPCTRSSNAPATVYNIHIFYGQYMGSNAASDRRSLIPQNLFGRIPR